MADDTTVYVNDNGSLLSKRVSSEEAILLYRNDPLSIYPKYFFQRMIRIRNWQNLVGEMIAERWNLKSAIDFGCASGYHLEGMSKKGVFVKGYEFAYDNAKDFISTGMKDNIFYGDVQTDLVSEKFDLSMSIEVAEHILEENSEVLVRNLTGSSDKFIIFSAAKPGEEGTGHINLHSSEFWLELFEKNNFVESKSDTNDLRNIFKISSNRKYSKFLAKKVLFLKKKI